MKFPATLLMLLAGPIAAGAGTQAGNDGDITQVFSQFLGYRIPQGFTPVFQGTTAANYIQEWVPPGETVEQWTQMITVSAGKDLARDRAARPGDFVMRIANQFVEACPGTFSNRVLDPVSIDGHETFMALLGCGNVRAETPHSEVALIIAIKGRSDMYTIQWAERSAAIRQSPALDQEKWIGRYQQLMPLRICDPASGKKVAPSPSCTDGRDAPPQ